MAIDSMMRIVGNAVDGGFIMGLGACALGLSRTPLTLGLSYGACCYGLRGLVEELTQGRGLQQDRIRLLGLIVTISCISISVLHALGFTFKLSQILSIHYVGARLVSPYLAKWMGHWRLSELLLGPCSSTQIPFDLFPILDLSHAMKGRELLRLGGVNSIAPLLVKVLNPISRLMLLEKNNTLESRALVQNRGRYREGRASLSCL